MGKSSIVATEDGSSTLVSSIFNERYHSIYGATTESQVVFINAGLVDAVDRTSSVKILEMGFGTGLNALMSWNYADDHKVDVEYTGYEKFPITSEIASELEYGSLFKSKEDYLNLHDCSADQFHKFSTHFTFRKRLTDIDELSDQDYYDVIYFDAFAPAAQEELWSVELFEKMYNSLQNQGVLVTYCAKGQVKRNLRAAGFEVTGLPGPPGKREMTKATKAI